MHEIESLKWPSVLRFLSINAFVPFWKDCGLQLQKSSSETLRGYAELAYDSILTGNDLESEKKAIDTFKFSIQNEIPRESADILYWCTSYYVYTVQETLLESAWLNFFFEIWRDRASFSQNTGFPLERIEYFMNVLNQELFSKKIFDLAKELSHSKSSWDKRVYSSSTPENAVVDDFVHLMHTSAVQRIWYQNFQKDLTEQERDKIIIIFQKKAPSYVPVLDKDRITVPDFRKTVEFG
jgi:hypothetical protein